MWKARGGEQKLLDGLEMLGRQPLLVILLDYYLRLLLGNCGYAGVKLEWKINMIWGWHFGVESNIGLLKWFMV